MISVIIIAILIGFIIGILIYFLVPQKKKFDDGFNLAIKDIGRAAEELYKKELQEKTLKIEQDIAAIEGKKNNLSKKYQDAILEFENDYKNKTEDKKVAIEKIMQEQIQEMKAENEKQRISPLFFTVYSSEFRKISFSRPFRESVREASFRIPFLQALSSRNPFPYFPFL